MTCPQLYVVTRHIPAIGARKGMFVLDPGTGSLCVFHPASLADLPPEDRTSLSPCPISAESQDS